MFVSIRSALHVKGLNDIASYDCSVHVRRNFSNFLNHCSR